MLLLVINVALTVARLLVPAFFAGKEDSAIDAKQQPELRRRLQKRIRSVWAVVPLLVCVLFLAGCSNPLYKTRTVYVPHGEPVRIRETLRNVPVWIKDKDGTLIEGVVDIPEGWYSLPLEIEETPPSRKEKPQENPSQPLPSTGDCIGGKCRIITF